MAAVRSRTEASLGQLPPKVSSARRCLQEGVVFRFSIRRCSEAARSLEAVGAPCYSETDANDASCELRDEMPERGTREEKVQQLA